MSPPTGKIVNFLCGVISQKNLSVSVCSLGYFSAEAPKRQIPDLSKENTADLS